MRLYELLLSVAAVLYVVNASHCLVVQIWQWARYRYGKNGKAHDKWLMDSRVGIFASLTGSTDIGEACTNGYDVAHGWLANTARSPDATVDDANPATDAANINDDEETEKDTVKA